MFSKIKAKEVVFWFPTKLQKKSEEKKQELFIWAT